MDQTFLGADFARQHEADVGASALQSFCSHPRYGYDVPWGLISAWISSGAGFQLEYDLSTDEGLDSLVYWWFQIGRREFPGMRELIDEPLARHLHIDHLPAIARSGRLALTPLLEIVLRGRADLREAFDVASEKGVAQYWYWWLTVGEMELAGAPTWLAEAEREALHAINLSAFPRGGTLAPTMLVQLCWERGAHERALATEDPSGISAAWWQFLVDDRLHMHLPNDGLPVVTCASAPGPIVAGTLRRGDVLSTTFALLYATRLDLRASFDLETVEGTRKFLFWWFGYGRWEHPVLAERIDRELLNVLHLSPLGRSQGVGVPELTPLLELIAGERGDLQTLAPDDSAEAAHSLWRWWIHSGQQEYLGTLSWFPEAQFECLHVSSWESFGQTGVLAPSPVMWLYQLVWPQVELLTDAASETSRIAFWQNFVGAGRAAMGGPADAVVPALPDAGHARGPYLATRFLEHLPAEAALVYTLRPDLRAHFDLRQEAGFLGYVHWWLLFGRKEYPQWAAAVLDMLLEYQLEADAVPMALRAVLAARPDVAFNLATSAGRQAALHWWLDHGHAECLGSQAAPADTESDNASLEPDKAIALVGYPHGEFGLGEDIRLLRSAFDAVAVPTIVMRAPWKIMAREQAEERSVATATADFAREVMIYVMPAFDTLTLLNKVGARAFSARRRIGFWQWELERFPETAILAMDLVDEIWCHSEHAAKAFRGATDKPVIKVPLPVLVPRIETVDRALFDLPAKGFVVFTSFDGASSIARKNPLASILAFQSAFPGREHANARLVVKAMNVLDDSLWRECLRKAAADPRILIRNEVMDRRAYYELLACCDAVISLHRAEGFGRLMAEAMGMGIPVIASAYSGNMDFMNEANSWLVGGQQISVLPGDYAFFEGQVWLEPEVDEAATALRNCLVDEEERRKRTVAARETIALYSPERCGAIYRELLAIRYRTPSLQRAFVVSWP